MANLLILFRYTPKIEQAVIVSIAHPHNRNNNPPADKIDLEGVDVWRIRSVCHYNATTYLTSGSWVLEELA